MCDGIINVHCSGLPRIEKCQQSIHGKQDVRIEFDDEIARTGIACHEIFENMLRGNNPPDISWIADKHSIYDTDDLSKMYAYINKAWFLEGLKDLFVPDRHLNTEEELSAQLTDKVLLSGRADMSWWNPAGISKVLDLKTGRVYKDVWGQVKGYLILQIEKFLKNYPFTDLKEWKFWGYVLWLRHWIYESKEFTYEQLMEYKQRIIDMVETKNPKYTVSAECEYCPRRFVDCDEYPNYVGKIISIGTSILDFDFDKNADYYFEVDNGFKQLQKLCDLWKQVKTERLKAGPIKLSDGTIISRETIFKRQINDLVKLKPIAYKYMSTEDFIRCLDIKFSSLEKQIRANAGRGKGSARMREFEQDLEENHLLSKVPHSSKTVIIKPEKEITSEQ